MDKPTVLYRGAQEKLDILSPTPILETEKHRFPPGTEAVVFASVYKQEALAYAIASRKNLSGLSFAPYWKNEATEELGWRLFLDCTHNDLPADDTTYLYELDPTHFEQDTKGEFFSTQPETPTNRTEYTIGEALNEFDEVHFRLDEVNLHGEGQSGILK